LGEGTVSIAKDGDSYIINYTIPYAQGELIGTYVGSVEKRD